VNVNSYYEILMVTRDAPPEVIRAAYKALSQKWHPDKNDHESAPEIMAMINTAYAELSDPDKRRAYHQWLEAEEMRWAFQHPQPQPDYRPPEPEKPAAPPAPKRRAFEIDDDKVNATLAELAKRDRWKLGRGQKRVLWALLTGGILGGIT
jgi:curved DNA-binding protein CbpA